MSSVNKVILVGHLGADPELRYTSSGQAVCKLSVATNRRWRDAEGNQQEQTDWHKVTAWGKQGEVCRDHLKKGRQVYVEGRLRNSSYNDKEGQRRFSTEVVSQSVVFLGSNDYRQGGTFPRDDQRQADDHRGGYRQESSAEMPTHDASTPNGPMGDGPMGNGPMGNGPMGNGASVAADAPRAVEEPVRGDDLPF